MSKRNSDTYQVCRNAMTGRFAPLRMAKQYPGRYVLETRQRKPKP